MSAHIRLFGEKHFLSSRTLQVIMDSVDAVDPALQEGIAAYLDQVVEDDIGDEPLVALEQVGRDILAILPRLPSLGTVAWARDIRGIGDITIEYATQGWPDTPEANEAAYSTLGQHCADLGHWASMLGIYGYPIVSADVDELVKRFNRIINSMELCG